MNKTVKIIIAVVAVIIVVAAILAGGFAVNNNSKPTSNLSINSAGDLTTLVDQIYAGVSVELPTVETIQLDITDSDVVKVYTGLENGDDLEYLVVSEPMVISTAYSMILAKVKDGANVDELAKAMNENINESKWITITADKIYTTTSGNVICLVMANAETAVPVFENFKTIAGSVEQVYERSAGESKIVEDILTEPSEDLIENLPEDALVDREEY